MVTKDFLSWPITFAILGAADLYFQQLVDGFLIPGDGVVRSQALDPVPERCIAQVFEQKNSVFFPSAENLRHIDAGPAEKTVHVQKWQFFRPFLEYRQLLARKR